MPEEKEQQDLCPICDCFKENEFKHDIPGFKGVCITPEGERWLTNSVKRTCCIDYVPVIPEIEVVVSND